MTGRWFSPGTPDSFTNKTDRHDITEILLKVKLSNINQTKPNQIVTCSCCYIAEKLFYFYTTTLYRPDLYLCFPEQSCSDDEDDNGEAEGKVANQCVV